MNIQEYAYFEGDFVKSDDAKISIMTHAFMYGTSIFEGIRACWNPDKKKLYVVKAKEHFDRILRSGKILRMDVGLSAEDMIEKMIELLKKNKPETDTYIRPVLYKSGLRIGPGLLGKEKDDAFLMSSIDLGDYVDTNKGLSVCTSHWRRLDDNVIPPRGKIGGSYVNTALAKSDAVLAGFDEAIFLTQEGKISEGSAMNLFIIRDGQLVTPGFNNNILEGITRDFIIDIAKKELGLETVVRKIDKSELYIAEEAFFVGTAAQVAPISKIDNYEIGYGKNQGEPGQISSKLKSLYHEICKGNMKGYDDALIELDY